MVSNTWGHRSQEQQQQLVSPHSHLLLDAKEQHVVFPPARVAAPCHSFGVSPAVVGVGACFLLGVALYEQTQRLYLLGISTLARRREIRSCPHGEKGAGAIVVATYRLLIGCACREGLMLMLPLVLALLLVLELLVLALVLALVPTIQLKLSAKLFVVLVVAVAEVIVVVIGVFVVLMSRASSRLQVLKDLVHFVESLLVVHI